MKTLLDQQKKYLDYFFEHLDVEKANQILDAFFACKGSLIFSGVGKSGIIAQKLATTIASTGTRAFYLSPTNAMHGDIGLAHKEDLFVLLSKSGGTKELLHLVPFIREKGAKVLSFHSSENSELAKISDLSICLPLMRELCPFNLAPTTSAALQLIFGDVLAVALMEKKNFGIKEYVLNHPAGIIGKKLTLKVDDIMRKGDEIPTCKPTDLLLDVLHEISNKCCGCLLVTDENKKLLGIFTDGDLRRSLQNLGSDAMHQTIASVMTKNPKTIEGNILAFDAMQLMEKDPKRLITVLPVLEKGKVAGILRMHDILQAGL